MMHNGTIAGAVIALVMIILLAVNACSPFNQNLDSYLGCITDSECENG